MEFPSIISNSPVKTRDMQTTPGRKDGILISDCFTGNRKLQLRRWSGFLLCILRDLRVSIEFFKIIRAVAVLLLGALAFPNLALAHIGPPFPIMVDQPVAGYMVTVLANPDTGQAVCIVLMDPGESKAIVPVSKIEVWVQPVSRRLPKAVYPMTQEPGRGPLRFVAQPEFDVAEMWTLGIDLHFANGKEEHLITRVEATPPGIGPWGLLFFLFPIILFGGLALLVFTRRARGRAPKTTAPHCTRTINSGHPENRP